MKHSIIYTTPTGEAFGVRGDDPDLMLKALAELIEYGSPASIMFNEVGTCEACGGTGTVPHTFIKLGKKMTCATCSGSGIRWG